MTCLGTMLTCFSADIMSGSAARLAKELKELGDRTKKDSKAEIVLFPQVTSIALRRRTYRAVLLSVAAEPVGLVHLDSIHPWSASGDRILSAHAVLRRPARFAV